MRHLRMVMGILVLALGAGWAHAKDCADQTQAGLDACAEAEFQKSDRELNEAYQALLKQVGGDQKAREALVSAQKTWIAFRDADCNYLVKDWEGGSIRPMLAAICFKEQTAARARQLRGYAHCERGEAGCPTSTCMACPAN